MVPPVKEQTMAKRKSAASTKSVPLSERPIEEVWIEYTKTGTDLIRNFLLEKYLPLVKYNAERLHTKLPDEVDVDDLKQAGIFGAAEPRARRQSPAEPLDGEAGDDADRGARRRPPAEQGHPRGQQDRQGPQRCDAHVSDVLAGV